MADIYRAYQEHGEHPYAVLRGGKQVATCDQWEDYPPARQEFWTKTQEWLEKKVEKRELVFRDRVYATYYDVSGGVNYAGDPLPLWGGMSKEQHDKWGAVAAWANGQLVDD